MISHSSRGAYRCSVIARAPVLGDQAYGDDSKLRTRLDGEQLEYVLSVAPTTTVFEPGTRFEVPPAKLGAGRPRTVPKPDRKHTPVKTLAAALPASAWQTVTYRDRDDRPIRSTFAFVRMIAAHPVPPSRPRGPRAHRRAPAWSQTRRCRGSSPSDAAPDPRTTPRAVAVGV